MCGFYLTTKGTLRENLLYPQPFAAASADPAVLREALRRIGLEHLGGYICERGGGGGEAALDWDSVASAGEKQRIAVARTLLQAPSLVSKCSNALNCSWAPLSLLTH